MVSEERDDCVDVVEQEREKLRVTSSSWSENADRGANLGRKENQVSLR